MDCQGASVTSRERSLAHELAEAAYMYVSRCCDCVLGEGPFHEGNKKQKADWGRERFRRKEEQ